jgi:ABC-type lipoprotein export system ATPase subunit
VTASHREEQAMTQTVTGQMAVVECTDVSRTYGCGPTAVHAVRGVSCRVGPAERIAVTGPSGSGKTTLLHLIAGLDRPTSGSVRWPALPDIGRQAIGIVFQGPSLLPSLDVTENVALPLLFAGGDYGAATRRARSALQLLGIEDLAVKLPDELSGGQSQRVAIARVLAARPALILADEPTALLDHHTADAVITALLDTAITIGAAVVAFTHDPAIAARMPGRWVMRDGQLDVHPAAHGHEP